MTPRRRLNLMQKNGTNEHYDILYFEGVEQQIGQRNREKTRLSERARRVKTNRNRKHKAKKETKR